MRSILLVLFFQAYLAFGTDCKSVKFDQEYEFSDIVFFGRVIEVTDSLYRIKVLENYKKEISDTLVGKVIDGQQVPNKGSYWLIYGFYDGNIFYTSECSGSKSVERPFGFHDFSFPLPAPKSLQNNRQLQDIFWDLQKNKSLNEFYFEISSLRELSRKREVAVLTRQVLELQDQNSQLIGLVYNLQYWVIGLGIIVIFGFAIMIYKGVSKS